MDSVRSYDHIERDKRLKRLAEKRKAKPAEKPKRPSKSSKTRQLAIAPREDASRTGAPPNPPTSVPTAATHPTIDTATTRNMNSGATFDFNAFCGGDADADNRDFYSPPDTHPGLGTNQVPTIVLSYGTSVGQGNAASGTPGWERHGSHSNAHNASAYNESQPNPQQPNDQYGPQGQALPQYFHHGHARNVDVPHPFTSFICNGHGVNGESSFDDLPPETIYSDDIRMHANPVNPGQFMSNLPSEHVNSQTGTGGDVFGGSSFVSLPPESMNMHINDPPNGIFGRQGNIASGASGWGQYASHSNARNASTYNEQFDAYGDGMYVRNHDGTYPQRYI